MKDLIRVQIVAKPKALERIYKLLSDNYDIVYEAEPRPAISPKFRIQRINLTEKEDYENF